MIWLCRLGKRPAFRELLSVVTQWSRCYIHSLSQSVIIFTNNDWQHQLGEYDYTKHTSSSCCTFTESKLRSCHWLSAVSGQRLFSRLSFYAALVQNLPVTMSSLLHPGLRPLPSRASTSAFLIYLWWYPPQCLLDHVSWSFTSTLHMSRPAHTSDGPGTHFQH